MEIIVQILRTGKTLYSIWDLDLPRGYLISWQYTYAIT